MSDDDDKLDEFDLSAWDVPPPPAGLADSVIARMGGTDVSIAIPVESREPRRAWWIAGAAAATLAIAAGIWGIARNTEPAVPASGTLIADRARVLSLGTVEATLDAGAEVRWQRKGSVLHVEQRTGVVAWRVDSGQKLVIDAGAARASVEARGANLRVEVQMNATDARVIGASAVTAAAVAILTVVVYEGHVNVSRPGQQTVVVAPGTTYKADPEIEAPVVGASAPSDDGVPVVGVLGLEGSDVEPDVWTAIGAGIRVEAMMGSGPYKHVQGAVRRLVPEKTRFGCADEAPACMTKIGEDWKVDALVYGRVERDGEEYRLSVKLLDVDAGTVARTYAQQIDADATDHELQEIGKRAYVQLVGSTTTACDMDTLRDQGMEHLNLGQHAAALELFEQALVCKHDPYILQLAFMASCSSRDSAKAKLYYKQLSPAQQAKFAQMCIRERVAFQDDEPAACDEVSCVLNNYEGECCRKFKQTPRRSTTIETLGRAEISQGVASVKDQIRACDKYPASGKVVAKVKVNPDGRVASIAIDTTPAPALGACVADALRAARFAKSQKGGSFSYPFVFSGTCDANTMRERAMENINLGQHAAALANLEAALRCNPGDSYLVQLAFMVSCASKNAAKAKHYFARLTENQQSKFRLMCEREGVPYTDKDPGAETGYLQVQSKPAAKVLVDGQDTGLTTPITGKQLELTPGRHRLTLVVGANRFSYTVIIKAGETTKVSKDLE